MNGGKAQRWALWLLIIILAGGILYLVTNRDTPPIAEAEEPGSVLPSNEEEQTEDEAPIISTKIPDERSEIPGMFALSNRLNLPDATVQDDMEVLGELVRQYYRLVKEVPGGGLNDEIVTSLRGRNKKGFVFFPPKHAKVNAQGELLDRFGNPYYFHPLSRKELEVISMGPDGKLYTDDDLKAP